MTASTSISGATARAGVNIHQFYSLDLKGAPAAALADIYAFDGTRGIGEPTQYTIQFTHPRHDLSRGEFLNRMGALVVQPPPRDRWSEPEDPRRVQGVVTSFALKDTNRDQSLYEIVLESRLALLRKSDAMELVSQKDMRTTSADGTATVSAANGVVLSGGGTAYVKAELKQLQCGASEDMNFWRPDNQRKSGMHERGDQQDMTVLRAVWQKLNLPGPVQFRWVPHAGTANHIETWFADAWPCDFRLLLGCQLHEEGMEPPWSEAAVALLLTSLGVLRRFEGKLRPQARLFRPIAMPSDSMVEAVETLLAAEQTPRGRIRHLWLTDLPREGRHATRGAVKEAGLELAVHDIDYAIGKPGPANGLLVQALAAQMVGHGQGAQLVASPDARSVRLNLVGSQFAPVPRIEAGYMRVLSLSISGGGACSLILILFALNALGASKGWFWVCLAGFLLLLPIQIGGSILNRRLLEDDFYRQLWRLGART